MARALSSDPRMSSLLLEASKEVPFPPHVKQDSQRGHMECGKLMSHRFTLHHAIDKQTAIADCRKQDKFNQANETNTQK